jgi:hypothetical protein
MESISIFCCGADRDRHEPKNIYTYEYGYEPEYEEL